MTLTNVIKKKNIQIAIYCSEGIIDNANYTQTQVGQTGSGVCQFGWAGTPTIYCDIVDDVPTWSETINDPCQGLDFLSTFFHCIKLKL